MAGTTNDEAGAGKSVEGNSSAQCYQSGEALAEWRSSEQVENALPSTSPPYWESDDDDEDDGGPKPSQLYGKHTWRIDKFSQTTKRELRSNAFEVGGYKWYILIYPQGCDVCNHLSLFLCVANHDKLLPGWSHFAQFTIAVVNKDPKKSKYSDTLHRFWKKEHDWGWKKFMELSKVSEGFLDAADTLIIKAQVQVIREKADRPFRCLDAVYRRELVRVYLTNVETICRRFMEDKRGKLGKLIEDKSRWTSFSAFWLGIDQNTQRRMSREKRDVILKVMVKHFFIEKEVTSTLVMDSLYSGLKALEGHANSKKARAKLLDSEESAAPVVCVEKDMFVLVDDVLLLLERVALEPLPPKDEKGPQNRTKEGNSTEDFNKDSVERDERRLTELGRRTVETFVLAHIFNHKIEVAYQEAVALKRQEELIREEEFEAWLAAGSAQKNKQGGNDKEKKSKKKQSKQKRNSRKGKDKVKDERSTVASLDKHQEENTCNVKKVQSIEELQPVVEKLDILEGVSDVSDNIEFVAEAPQPDSEDRDASPVNWDTDASEVHPPTEASSSGISGSSSVPNGGTERRNTSAMDDSSSTCSTDSILSIPVNGSYKGNSYSNFHHEKSSSRRKNQKVKMTSEGSRIPDRDGSDHNTANGPGRTVECDSEAAVRDRVSESHPIAVRKEEDNGSVEKNSSIKETFNVERSLKERPTSASSSSSPPRSPPKNIPSYLQLSSDNKSSPSVERDGIQLKKSSNDSQAADKLTYPVPSPQNSVMTKAETQQAVTSKPSEKTAPQVSPMSRPSSAPLTHGLRPATPVVSVVPTCPLLSRSISAAGRLGPDNLMANYVPQSYRNAIIGNSVGPSTSGFSHSASTSSSTTICPAHKQPSSLVSSSMFSPQNSGGIDPSGVCRGARDASHGGTLWVDGSPRDPARGMRCDSSSSMDGFQNHDLSHRVHTGFSDQFSRELPACPSGRQTQGVVTDEFPHLDIINDLLNDEHAVGMGADTGRFSHSFNNGPQVLSRQFSFPYDVGASGNVNSSAGSSCRFERTRSYHDMGFQGGYNSFSSHLETMRDFIPQANPRPFMNDQIEGMIPPNQWQLSGSNLSSMDMRTRETEGLPYFTPEFPDVNPVNGYTIYRPSKRH